MRRIVLTFGFLSGALLALMMWLTIPFADQLGAAHSEYGMVIGYTTMVLAGLFIYFGIRTYRDTVSDGTIAFRSAVKVGVLIALVASAFYIVSWEIMYKWVTPDYMEKYAATALEKARAAGATAEQVATQAREMAVWAERYKNPLFRVALTFAEVFPVGLIMTLVSAGLLRRSPKGRENPVSLRAASPAR